MFKRGDIVTLKPESQIVDTTTNNWYDLTNGATVLVEGFSGGAISFLYGGTVWLAVAEDASMDSDAKVSQLIDMTPSEDDDLIDLDDEDDEDDDWDFDDDEDDEDEEIDLEELADDEEDDDYDEEDEF